ncbi:MAG: LacI family DNA-binding transcriptional regulator [Bacteroidetes bacterium]|uniref:LacI family DNA-binding transcriptional regulator n=1 Tax=Candidatus Cryptobacteroides merdigallinarum TaxID=2840770 RepID=A0A9D9EI36_9BACT|nr:LacI family DNA-binding transcriptional regulator [Candidatus Cryptobacteroides merdigallinarum]
MKTTLDTIARNTGFSKSTISRVLNNKAYSSRISRETVEIILGEAERCGYTPNLIAKNLRKNHTQTIGLLVPSLSNPYFAEIASVIISEAQKCGYTTLVSDTKEDEELQNSSITTLISRPVDGIIIVPCGNDPAYLEQTNSQCVPVILVDRYYENSPLPYVVTNNFQGGYLATSLLIKNGHRDIACIQGPPGATPNKKRIEGYLLVLKENGLEDRATIVGNEFSVQNGYLETKLLLNNEKRPTAIFALSNTIGLGAIKAIREARLKIPDDISLVSYDNNMYLDYLEPSITRIGQMVDEMGKMAVKLLHESISGHKEIRSQIELSPEMILRESVAPLIG